MCTEVGIYKKNKNSTKKVIKKKRKFFFLIAFLVEFLFSFMNSHLKRQLLAGHFLTTNDSIIMFKIILEQPVAAAFWEG